jgi:amino-acid N-acetyltransferase
MKSKTKYRFANILDTEVIYYLLSSNDDDISLFQQTIKGIKENIGDIVLAEDENNNAMGCAALHYYSSDIAEILAVSVLPAHKGCGIGNSLINHCIDIAISNNINILWLATAKPNYFNRFGFKPISKWSLPLVIIIHKMRLVFQQPIKRWIPALFGRHTFMKYKKGIIREGE